LLPVYSDLFKLDRNLAVATVRHPDAFAHLPRAPYTARKIKWLSALVKEAEQLAAQTYGVLAITQQFQREHNSLTMAIRRNPKAFAHIPRTRRKMRTIAEHVQHANTLAAHNDGKLPADSVLRREHPALREATKEHPEAFAHLKRKSLHTSIQEYVEQAGELALKHEGVIPSCSWLRKNGFWNLGTAIYNRPHKFAGMRQEVFSGSKNSTVKIKTL
jgi:hypothetical protein